MNSKQRKLIYIREKNYLRHGGKRSLCIDVSGEVIEDNAFMDSFVRNMIRDLEKKFKMGFDTEVRANWETAENIMKNIVTIKITFKKA